MFLMLQIKKELGVQRKDYSQKNTDNRWCSFSSLESAERREGTEGRHKCHVTALGRDGICKIFGVGYVSITFTLPKSASNYCLGTVEMSLYFCNVLRTPRQCSCNYSHCQNGRQKFRTAALNNLSTQESKSRI